jgi:hypothetical protein
MGRAEWARLPFYSLHFSTSDEGVREFKAKKNVERIGGNSSLREWFKISLIIGLGVAVRLIAMGLYPHSSFGPVDDYYVDRQAAQAILALSNPYTYHYVVHGTQEVFAYLPFVPLYYAPFYVLGNIRYGNILSDALIMLGVYWIAKSLDPRRALYAPLVFAILPVSFWLTSIASTNVMIGAAFFTLSIAASLRSRFAASAILLGLAIAANQLLLLSLPILVYYFWRGHKLSYLSISAAVSLAIVLPFFALAPSRFLYDTLMFQFSRPYQPNGYFSLYGILYAFLHWKTSLVVRAAVFLVPTGGMLILARKRPELLAGEIGVTLLVGAFVLPVDGFWNYFLPGFVMGCALIPSFVGYVRRGSEHETPTLPGILTTNSTGR